MKSRINTHTAIRIIITIVLWTTALGLIIAVTSCRAARDITHSSHTQTSTSADSTGITDIRAAARLRRRADTAHDTTQIRDTVIIRDTLNVAQKGDTVTITHTRWRDRIITRWRDRDTSRTDTILTTDTIIRWRDRITAHTDTITDTRSEDRRNTAPGTRLFKTLTAILAVIAVIAVITIARNIRTRLRI